MVNVPERTCRLQYVVVPVDREFHEQSTPVLLPGLFRAGGKDSVAGSHKDSVLLYLLQEPAGIVFPYKKAREMKYQRL